MSHIHPYTAIRNQIKPTVLRYFSTTYLTWISNNTKHMYCKIKSYSQTKEEKRPVIIWAITNIIEEFQNLLDNILGWIRYVNTIKYNTYLSKFILFHTFIINYSFYVLKGSVRPCNYKIFLFSPSYNSLCSFSLFCCIA